MRFLCTKAFLFLCFIAFKPSFAQVQPQDSITDRPEFKAVALSQEPVIDGEVINDPVWKTLPAVQDLIQLRPNYGEPVSEKTVIRVAYSASTFYVSVVCYDKDAKNIVVSDSRRDADLNDEDSFLFIIDTYNDRQNGFLFGTNAQGMEYDAQIDNEGRGSFNTNRQQGGVIGGTNLNWDATWKVKSQLGDYGWSAEFAIPFRSLRFASGENKTWGLNFRRNISKNTETAFWTTLPLGFDMKRLSLAGKLNGLKLQNPGNLKLIPYALTQFVNNKAVSPNENDTNFEVGADIKYSVTPSLTLDLTYNTDFAQVEVDDQQVNLDRFNLFFPEKRAFFLENGRHYYACIYCFGCDSMGDFFFTRSKVGEVHGFF